MNRPNLAAAACRIQETFDKGTMAEKTMKAVVFKGPYKVALEDRPIPKIQDPTDIVVKVIYSALCGRSEDMESGR